VLFLNNIVGSLSIDNPQVT